MASLKKMVIATSVNGAEVKVNRKDLGRSVHCYAVIVRNGKILISPQWTENGFVFPGGSVELGENHLDGLVREVFEETGYTIRPRHVIDVFSTIFMNFKINKAEQSLLVFYAADVVKGRLSIDGFDKHEKKYAKQAIWVTLDDIKIMHFACNTQEPIKTLLPYLERMM